MKKILLLSMLAIGISQASYRVTLPIDANIQFKNKPTIEEPIEEWIKGTPVMGEWTNKDDPFDCSTLPSTADYSTGVSFTQTKTCSQNQEQTVRIPETSTVSNEVRYVDTINQQIISINESLNAVGERYTNIIKVGYYTLSTNQYSGYLNPNYKTYPDYNAFVEQIQSTLTPNSIGGLEIRWMWSFVDGNLIIMPSNKSRQNELLKYKVTINGITCPLEIHTYEMDVVLGKNCFSFINKSGSEFKIDVSLK